MSAIRSGGGGAQCQCGRSPLGATRAGADRTEVARVAKPAGAGACAACASRPGTRGWRRGAHTAPWWPSSFALSQGFHFNSVYLSTRECCGGSLEQSGSIVLLNLVPVVLLLVIVLLRSTMVSGVLYYRGRRELGESVLSQSHPSERFDSTGVFTRGESRRTRATIVLPVAPWFGCIFFGEN